MTLANSKYKTLHNNFAQGGCVFSNGNVVAVNTKFSGCSTRAANNFIASGSAIHARGVILLDSIVTGSIADAGDVSTGAGWGAGIYNHGDLTVKYSSVSNNSTILGSGGSNGGGIRTGYGDVYILSSTIANNTANIYGGLHITGGAGPYTAKIYNSTFSGNTADFGPGGLGSEFDTTIANSTIAFNTTGSANGGGARILNAAVNIQSTIVANNIGSSGSSDLDVSSATSVTGANNLITQITGTSPSGTITSCPRLGRLSDNGGLTLTHRLLANSPALDTGNNTTKNFTYDQRGSGHPRKVGTQTDIGAFEYGGGTSDEIFRYEFESRCN